jgi:hypothetical protein
MVDSRKKVHQKAFTEKAYNEAIEIYRLSGKAEMDKAEEVMANANLVYEQAHKDYTRGL